MKVWTSSACRVVESLGGVNSLREQEQRKDGQNGPPKEFGDAYVWEVTEARGQEGTENRAEEDDRAAVWKPRPSIRLAGLSTVKPSGKTQP